MTICTGRCMLKCLPRYAWKGVGEWVLLVYCLACPLQSFAEQDSTAISQTTRSTPENTLRPPFGRLFTTPQERDLLNSLRQQQVTKAPASTQAESVATGDQAPPSTDSFTASTHAQSLKLSGILIRADGKQQVWINGELQPPLKIPVRPQSHSSETTRSATLGVPLKQQNQSTIVKPGQVWNPESGEITESYRRSTNQPPTIVVP